jgi:hypothetical protein
VYALARTEQGAQSLVGLIPEAFHGTEGVVTGVQARNLSQEEQAYIVLHARAFTPSTRVEVIPEVMSGYADSTLLTMFHPGCGLHSARYVRTWHRLDRPEREPRFYFYPNMPGDLG